jgi:3-oxoacyl-[acyl-carrier-protein] synthase III
MIGLGIWLPDTIVQSTLASEPAKGLAARDPLLDIDLGSAHDAAILRNMVERERLDPARGTRARHVALTESNAFAAAAAARCALADAGVDGDDVSHVLSWALVPDDVGAHAPKVAQLAGVRNARAFDVDAACASVVVQMELATALIESGRATAVLCTQSHLLSRAVPDGSRVRHFLGDAATAMVVTARPKQIAFQIESDGADAEAVVWCRADGSRIPWYLAGERFVPGTRDPMRAQQLVANTLSIGSTAIRAVCEKASRDPRAIDVIGTIHPRGWVPEGIARSLDLGPERAFSTFARTAHVGGCGVVANLLEARAQGVLKAGAKVALFAQGAGFTRAAAFLEWE